MEKFLSAWEQGMALIPRNSEPAVGRLEADMFLYAGRGAGGSICGHFFLRMRSQAALPHMEEVMLAAKRRSNRKHRRFLKPKKQRATASAMTRLTSIGMRAYLNWMYASNF